MMNGGLRMVDDFLMYRALNETVLCILYDFHSYLQSSIVNHPSSIIHPTAIFQYLDRYYIVRQNVASTIDVAHSAFKEDVFDRIKGMFEWWMLHDECWLMDDLVEKLLILYYVFPNKIHPSSLHSSSIIHHPFIHHPSSIIHR